MGDRSCYLAFCPMCDLAVSVVDDECPDCGATLAAGGSTDEE